MNNPLDHALRQLRRQRHGATPSPLSVAVLEAGTAPPPMPSDWAPPRTGGVRWVVEQDGTLHAIAA